MIGFPPALQGSRRGCPALDPLAVGRPLVPASRYDLWSVASERDTVNRSPVSPRWSDRFAGGGIPELSPPIIAPRDHQSAVGTECRCADAVVMREGRLDRREAMGVPELRGCIGASGDDPASVRAVGHALNRIRMGKNLRQRMEFAVPGGEIDSGHALQLGGFRRDELQASGQPDHPVSDHALFTQTQASIEGKFRG